MRLLALHSSYRKNGNTARIVRMVAEQVGELAAQAGLPVEVETIDLGHRSVQPCRGCRACFDRGEAECPVHDDLAAIKASMVAADVLLVGSPVYVEDVNGILKTWMDRLAHVNHRPEFAGKYAYALTTSGLKSSGHALRTMTTVLRVWGYALVGQARFTTGALMPAGEMAERYTARTRAIAAQIVDAVRLEKALRPSVMSLLFFAVQQRYWRRYADDSVDYAYWSGRGWTDPQQTYYVPHRAGRARVALARLAGAVIAPFVT